MDPLSITLSCVSLLKILATVSETLYKFIKDFQGARAELGAVDGELATLRRIVELIQHDCEAHKESDDEAFPAAVQTQISIVLGNCNDVLDDLPKLLEQHGKSKLGIAKFWAAKGKTEAGKIKSNLISHTGALNVALSLLEISIMRRIDVTTQKIAATATRVDIRTDMIKDGTEEILRKIQELQALLPGQHQENIMLRLYLDSLTSYADSVVEGRYALESDKGSKSVTDHGTNLVVAQRTIEHGASKQEDDADMTASKIIDQFAFRTLGDKDIRDIFEDLAIKVEGLARIGWNVDEKSWPFSKKERVWRIIYAGIFVSPFRVLGPLRNDLELQWAKHLGLDNVDMGRENAGEILPLKVTADPEIWRCQRITDFSYVGGHK